MTVRSRKALDKIAGHCEKTISYTTHLTREQFIADSKTMEATAFNLSQIGELVRYVDDALQNEAPHINWAAMRGLRNRIVHDYDSVNAAVIWATIQNDLPKLVKDIRALLDAYDSGNRY